ncbi:MAG: hypothetical protein PVH03_02555 [Chloroflexota bacterium]|jgi:hypothetical protein
MQRTAAITILAILAVIAGIVAVVDTLRYLQFLFSPLSFLGTPILGAILSGLVAIIWFWAASRIWNVDPQGWLFMVSIAAIYLIFDIVAIIAGTPVELLLPSIFVSALALILGLLPSTKREFGTG